MANNFFLNQDPLLFQNTYQRTLDAEDNMRRQLNEANLQYKLLQQQTPNGNLVSTRDLFGELDKLGKECEDSTITSLNTNKEYQRLKGELMNMVQDELMINIKWRLNSNPDAIKNMERQLEIIKESKKAIEDEQKRNLNELNDYVKNYSNLTFDEYKQMKNEETK